MEKEKIQCHSSTPKSDLIKLVERNKGQKILLHYEYNGYGTWGNDNMFEYDTSKEDDYNNILETIRTHYIHAIWCVGF